MILGEYTYRECFGGSDTDSGLLGSDTRTHVGKRLLDCAKRSIIYPYLESVHRTLYWQQHPYVVYVRSMRSLLPLNGLGPLGILLSRASVTFLGKNVE